MVVLEWHATGECPSQGPPVPYHQFTGEIVGALLEGFELAKDGFNIWKCRLGVLAGRNLYPVKKHPVGGHFT